MKWYIDRDFPEIKRESQNGPNEIIASISGDREVLAKIISTHNEEIDALEKDLALWKSGAKTQNAIIEALKEVGEHWRAKHDRLRMLSMGVYQWMQGFGYPKKFPDWTHHLINTATDSQHDNAGHQAQAKE